MKRGATLLLALLAACGSTGGHAQPSEAPAPASASRPWSGAREVLSRGGTWRVVYALDKTPIPRGETFALDAWVFDARASSGPDASDVPRTDVALAVDAAMPQHGHGMNRVPTVRKLEAGRFRVEGLFFHMPGRWELYFDVTREAWTERAQVAVDLD